MGVTEWRRQAAAAENRRLASSAGAERKFRVLARGGKCLGTFDGYSHDEVRKWAAAFFKRPEAELAAIPA